MSKSARLIKILFSLHNFILAINNRRDDIDEDDEEIEQFSDDPVSSSDDENEEIRPAGRSGIWSTRDKFLTRYFMPRLS